MSNPLKAVGKVFRKVGKVVKKIALPALAIGAAVLTGGAALGVFPAGVAGTLGVSGPLASVLTSAGQGALGGLILGGRKGAVTGLLAGGALGAVSNAVRPAMSAASGFNPDKAVSEAYGNIDRIGSSLASGGGAVTPAVTAGGAPRAAAASVPDAGSRSPAPPDEIAVSSLAPPPTPSISAGSAGSGGIGSLLSAPFRMLDGFDPYTRAGLIRGIGSGILAGSQARAEDRRERERQERIAANYEGSGNFYRSDSPVHGPGQPRPRVVWKIDPISGEAYRDYA